MDLNVTDNSGTTVTDNQNTEPVTSSTETGAASGQESGGTPAEDIFKGVDPAKLPPELKSVYNSMLTDYRTKTAKVSETIKSEIAKATETYQSKAQLYEQIAGQEEFVKQWNEYVQKAQTQKDNPVEGGDQALAKVEEKLKEITQKIQHSEMTQMTDAFAEAVDEKGQKVHGDFDQLNSIQLGKINNESFSLLRACIEISGGKSPQERLENGYKAAKAMRDQIFDEGKKAGMGRIQTKVQNATLPPSNSTGEVLTMTDKKPKSAREALEMAKRGQMVSRD